jgi:probable O-glycosylation ligase (exosortase A-associated)
MGLRDILLFLIIFGGVPFMVRWPWVGVMYWTWFGLMNPQQMAFGPAQTFPFALLIAGATVLGVLVSPGRLRIKGSREMAVLLILALWMTLTTVYALNPDGAWTAWERAMKVLLMTFVAAFAVSTKRHLQIFVATIALSVAYFGVKGGIFTIRTGGSYMVYGGGGFLSENNATGLAILMAIPLLWYFFLQSNRKWLKWSLATAGILSAAAVLGTQSRGAFVALSAMALFLLFKSPRRFRFALVLACVASALILFMPQTWDERMRTIQTYEQDSSAMGRINAWKMVTRLAIDRPLIGGGFDCYTPETYARYGSGNESDLVAHSIYFQMLGEHGWIALALFLLLWLLMWRDASAIIRACAGRPDLKWAAHLAAMLQTSLIGYLVGGAFLNLANWDMPYYLLVAVVITQDLVRRELERDHSAASMSESPHPASPSRRIPEPTH